MQKEAFHTWATEIATKHNFLIEKCVQVGTYYTKNHMRIMVFYGTYAYDQAMLTVYDDPRGSDEPHAIQAFHAHNTSDRIIAPELLGFEQYDAHRGWFITKQYSSWERPFASITSSQQRQTFLGLYAEYRNHLTIEPIRKLELREYLAAHEFHLHRLNNWFSLAMDAESARTIPVLDPSELIPRYTRALNEIRTVFQERKMIWCHGHFKGDVLLFDPEKDRYTLTEFARAGMYPEGYELAFLIWAHVFMRPSYDLDYTDWRAEIDTWISDLRTVADRLNIVEFDSLIRASIIERIMGTILADIASSDRSREDQTTRLSYLYRLYDQII